MLANELVVPGRRRRQLCDEIRRLAGAHGEEVHIALQRRLEEDFWRISDRIALRLECGRRDPEQRQDRDHGIEDDKRAGDRLWTPAGAADKKEGGGGGGGSWCLFSS